MHFSIPKTLAIVAACASTAFSSQVNALPTRFQYRDTKLDAKAAEAGSGLGGVTRTGEDLSHNFSSYSRDIEAREPNRPPGSVSIGTLPGQVFKGKNMAGKFGGKRDVEARDIEAREPNRPPGSVSIGTLPGQVFKGKNMAGKFGGKRDVEARDIEAREPNRPPGSVSIGQWPGKDFKGKSMAGKFGGKRDVEAGDIKPIKGSGLAGQFGKPAL